MISFNRPLQLAIIGGGFSGVSLAIHAIRASERALSIHIVEPKAEIGRGAAYGASDNTHRINVPSDRMSPFKDDPTHFTRWLFEHGFLPDAASTDELGRHYPSRSSFGAYIEHTLAVTKTKSRNSVEIHRRRTTATDLRARGVKWRVELSDGSHLTADIVALCVGHSISSPCPISAMARKSPKLVLNPWSPGALDTIESHDNILIAGTGLTMADVISTLDARGHQGKIEAVSRRGLLPRGHGLFAEDLDFFNGAAPPTTALGLLRFTRRRIQECAKSADWQSVIDALRVQLPSLWPTLPIDERRRIVHRVLPFWEVHRFRISPQAHAAIGRQLASDRLKIERAALASIDQHGAALAAHLQMRGGKLATRLYDAVVLCAGPSKNPGSDPLIANIVGHGIARMDEANLGLDVDSVSQVRNRQGKPQSSLLALGPMTRGRFGEMTGAPDIARQIERVINRVVSSGPSAASFEDSPGRQSA